MELLKKVQLILAGFCGTITVFLFLLTCMVKGTLLLFPNISDILSTILAVVYLTISIVIPIKYRKQLTLFVNRKIFKSPF